MDCWNKVEEVSPLLLSMKRRAYSHCRSHIQLYLKLLCNGICLQTGCWWCFCISGAMLVASPPGSQINMTWLNENLHTILVEIECAPQSLNDAKKNVYFYASTAISTTVECLQHGRMDNITLNLFHPIKILWKLSDWPQFHAIRLGTFQIKARPIFKKEKSCVNLTSWAYFLCTKATSEADAAAFIMERHAEQLPFFKGKYCVLSFIDSTQI